MIQFSTQPPAAAAQILRHWKLPDSDLFSARWLAFCTWLEDGEVCAIGGLEDCDGTPLLRSLAVAPEHQGRGLGLALAEALHARAEEAGFDSVYLLTLDKSDYFSSRLGYVAIERSDVPQAIAGSRQFSGLCPDSATLMQRSF